MSMTREERKRARRRDIWRTLGILAACVLIWIATSYTADAIMPVPEGMVAAAWQ